MDNTNTEAYQKPTAQVVGTIAEVTEGGADGDFLDAVYPVNTPKGDLTFS